MFPRSTRLPPVADRKRAADAGRSEPRRRLERRGTASSALLPFGYQDGNVSRVCDRHVGSPRPSRTGKFLESRNNPSRSRCYTPRPAGGSARMTVILSRPPA